MFPPPANEFDNRLVFIPPLIILNSDRYTSPSVDKSLCCYQARPSSRPPLWRCQGEHFEKRRKYSLEVYNKHLYETKFLEILLEYTSCRQAVHCWTLHISAVSSEVYYLAICVIHVCTNFVVKLVMTNNLFIVAPSTYGDPVWNVLYMTALTPSILNWTTYFWRIFCSPRVIHD